MTDGVWGNPAPTCYATDEDGNLPKTVAVSISENGKDFNEVGRNNFSAKKAAKAQARFEPKNARYVRATFIANYPQQDNFSPTFGFLSELAAYAP